MKKCKSCGYSGNESRFNSEYCVFCDKVIIEKRDVTATMYTEISQIKIANLLLDKIDKKLEDMNSKLGSIEDKLEDMD